MPLPLWGILRFVAASLLAASPFGLSQTSNPALPLERRRAALESQIQTIRQTQARAAAIARQALEQAQVREQALAAQGAAAATSPVSDLTVALGAALIAKVNGNERYFYLTKGKKDNSKQSKCSYCNIPVESTLGRQLVGRKLGDKFRITAPEGSFEIEIMSLDPGQERSAPQRR